MSIIISHVKSLKRAHNNFIIELGLGLKSGNTQKHQVKALQGKKNIKLNIK